jgi:hypothetical protein
MEYTNNWARKIDIIQANYQWHGKLKEYSIPISQTK